MYEIKYYLTAEVDGEVVFSSYYEDTVMLEAELRKAEVCVEREIDNNNEILLNDDEEGDIY